MPLGSAPQRLDRLGCWYTRECVFTTTRVAMLSSAAMSDAAA